MIGRILPPYRILEEISRGGMGVVYRAEDMRLGREVALKVLPEELLHDPSRRERLLDEARAASALEHPHIAVIHGVDDIDGVTFIAMELIRGEKLSDVLRRGPLPPHRALDLASEIAEGLVRAHEKAIIHRDIKPANVMVTEAGHAKIIDFGLAKLIERTDPDAATASLREGGSEPGVVRGTASYMSPEQARGVRVDHRSDIFSFGVTLFEMLTGRAAFPGTSTLDVMHAILTQPLPPLSGIAGLGPDAVAHVQRVLDKSTAKDPDDRYQGMKDVVVDLRLVRRMLDTGPRTAATGAVSDASSVGRRRSGPIVAAAAALAIVIAASLWWWPRNRPAPAAARSGKPAVAVLYFENNTGDASLDWMRTGLTDMLVTDLSQSRHIEVLATDRLHQILQQLRRADDRVLSAEVVDEVADRAGVDTVLVGSYLKAGDTIRIIARLQEARTGRIVTSERVEGSGESSVFSLVDELTRRFMAKMPTVAGPANLLAAPGEPAGEETLDRGLTDVTTPSVEAYRQYAEGINLHNRNLYAQAVPFFEKAIEIDPTFAMALTKLAVIHSNLGALDKSAEYGRRAIALVDRLATRERYYIEGFYYSLEPATVARSIEAYRQGLALHPDHHAARHNLGLRYYQLERYPEAIEQYEELLRRRSDSPATHGNLAHSYIATGDIRRALETTDAFVRQNPDSAAGYRNRGSALIAAGRLDDARGAFEKASALDPGFFATRIGEWTVAVLQRRWSDARAVLKQMTQAPDAFQRLLGVTFEGEMQAGQGRLGDALTTYDRAARSWDGSVEDRAFMRLRQAMLSSRAGRLPQALAYARQARADAGDSDVTTGALQVLAVALAASGRRSEAAQALKELESRAKMLPADLEMRRVHSVRGEIAALDGDLSAATAEMTKAVEMLPIRGPVLGPPSSHPDLLLSAALVHLRAGQDAAAAPLLERLQAGYEYVFSLDAYARSFYLLGQIYERRGDAGRAREQFARFVELRRDGELDRDQVADAQKKAGR